MLPHSLPGMPGAHAKELKDAEKVLRNFGKKSGGLGAGRRLLKAFQYQDPCKPGEVVGVKDPRFILCRHLLLADRCFPEKPVQWTPRVDCQCLAKTYLMPAGCPCKGMPLHTQAWLPDSLCGRCSICIRCGGWLGSQHVL